MFLYLAYNYIKKHNVHNFTSFSGGTGSGIDSIRISFHSGFKLLFIVFVLTVYNREKKISNEKKFWHILSSQENNELKVVKIFIKKLPGVLDGGLHKDHSLSCHALPDSVPFLY